MSAYSNQRRLAALGVACFVALSITNKASAVTVYSYTGANFNIFTHDDPLPVGSYTTAMKVSGSFTVAAPFAANLSSAPFGPSILDLSFTDGRQTINFSNFDPLETQLLITTNASAVITLFFFGVDTVRPTVVGGLLGQIRGSSFDSGAVFDQCLTVSSGACATFGIDTADEFSSGNLTLTSTDVAQTPLPAALPLFATGLSALGLLGWRRKRKAQAAA